MTESEWEHAEDYYPMLEYASGNLSDRKLRLFACACARRMWDGIVRDERSREAVEIAERFADGNALRLELASVLPVARFSSLVGHHNAREAASGFASMLVRESTQGSFGEQYMTVYRQESKKIAALLRHVVGNPFRPYRGFVSCLNSILSLGQAFYSGEPCHFALHDALLEAGHPELAAHFREPEHPKGCWALDLILGKS